MAGFVYVVHARVDQEYVAALVAYLASQGVTASADPERSEQIEDCDAVVVVMSPAAAESPVVNRELESAVRLGRPIAALLLDGEVFPVLAGLPWFDVRDRQMPSPELAVHLRHPHLANVQVPPARRRRGVVVALVAAATALVVLAGAGAYAVWRLRPFGASDAVAADPTHAPPPDGPLRIAVDFPFANWGQEGEDIYHALELYLTQQGGRAGEHEVVLSRYDSLDTVGCRASANKHAATPSEVAILGTGSEACTRDELVTLRDSSEPMLMVSPTEQYPGLTEKWQDNEPEKYYPASQRTFARVLPPTDAQGRASAMFAAEKLQVRACYVLYEQGLNHARAAEAFVAEAEQQGIQIVGQRRFVTNDTDFAPAFENAKSAGTDCVYVSASSFRRSHILKAKNAVLGSNSTVKLLGSSAFVEGSLLSDGGTSFFEMPEADGAFYLLAGLTPAYLVDRSDTAARFLEAFRTSIGRSQEEFGRSPVRRLLYSVQALQMILAAIEASDGSRHGVLTSVFGPAGTRVPETVAIVGKNVSIDPTTGDCTAMDHTALIVSQKQYWSYTAVRA